MSKWCVTFFAEYTTNKDLLLIKKSLFFLPKGSFA